MVKLGLGAALICFAFGGCLQLMTGIKEIESTKEKTTYRFMTGFNSEVSLSGTDTLNNSKGIKPNGN